jgi:hypothetical protein
MKHRLRAAVVPAVLVLLALVPALRAAVMTGNIKVTGAGPYTIGYILAQQAASMQVKVYTAGGALIRTIDVTDTSDTGPMAPGRHGLETGDLPPVEWDGNQANGSPAPRGTYYVEIVTTGAPNPVTTILGTRKRFTPEPGRTEARNAYGGDVNRDVTSPYHNLAVFGIGKTNANGTASSGAAIVNPDGTNILFKQDGAEGAYDYVTAGVLSDGTILLGGQGQKKLRHISQVDGSLIADYAAGKVDVRSMQVFGAGPNARVYFVDDQTPNGPLTGSIALLNPISKTDGTPIYETIVSQAQIAAGAGLTAGTIPGTRGLVVNRSETSLWLNGYQGTSTAPTNQFILRFDKVGGVWQQSATFNAGTPAVTSGVLRGCTLSPDEKLLWVTNAVASVPEGNRVFALDAATGQPASWEHEIFISASGGGDLTPQGITASAGGPDPATASYNLFVAGYATVPAAVTTANYVIVIAPPDNGSSDITRSPFFDVTLGATSVGITAGPTVENIKDTSATVFWMTDFRSSTIFHIGGAPGDYSLPDITVPGESTEHNVTITGLIPGTTYYYQVESRKDPLTPATATGSFTTAPHIRVVSETLDAGQTTATLGVTTNVAAEGTVSWGTDPAALTNTPISLPSGTTHTATFTGLNPGTTYYYRIAFTAPGAVALTTPVCALHTGVAGGSAGTKPMTDFAAARRENVVGAGPVTLAPQGSPGAPVQGPDLPLPLFNAGVAAAYSRLYVVGGSDSTDAAQTGVYYINILPDGSLDWTNGWKTATNPLPAARTQIAGATVAYNGRLYVVGGLDSAGTATNSVLYADINPATGDVGPWQGLDGTGAPVNPMPGARARGAARVIDGFLVVSGGLLSGVSRDNNYIAPIRPDGAPGPWVQGHPLAAARSLHRLLANAHEAYVIGGQLGDTAKQNSLDVATQQPTGDFTAFFPVHRYPGHADSTMNYPYFSMAAGLLGGKIVLAGGGRQSGITGNTDGTNSIIWSPIAADGRTGAWTVAAGTLPGAVADLDGAYWENTLYTAGGRTLSVAGPGNTTVPASTAVATVAGIPMDPDVPAGFATAGTLETPVLDLGAPTNLSHIAVSGSGVSASSVEVRYRFAGESGVWTDWLTLNGVSADVSGGARYVQYLLVLKGNGSSTPSVSGITLTTAAGVPTLTRADVERALRIAAGLVTASAADKTKLDADGDGAITLRDASRLNRTLNGK